MFSKRKKNILSVMIVFLINIFGFNGLNSLPDCDDCVGMPFSELKTMTTSCNESGREFIGIIEYRTRICNGVEELLIESIISGGSFPWEDDIQGVFHKLIRHLFIDNPMGFIPDSFLGSRDSLYSWKIMYPSCWSISGDTSSIPLTLPDGRILLPCEFELYCCKTASIIMSDTCDTKTYWYEEENGLPCMSDSVDPGCTNVCKESGDL